MTSTANPAPFQNASGFVVQDTTFNDYSGSTNIFDTGSQVLEQFRRDHVASDASFDANKVNKPGCSPQTRVRILRELADWMDDPNPASKIIWLYGPAGAGKSAIAQSTMQRAARDGRLGASFFFSRGAAGRTTADRLFPTIAYQLKQNIPRLAHSIDKVVREKPDLPFKSLDVQFRELVARPVQACDVSLNYPIVGIDGVDECDDESVQEAFLSVIGKAVTTNCPFRFIISSRPEPHIQRLFLRVFHLHTKGIVLETSEESLDDVLTYFRYGFADICERHSAFMRHVPLPWPPHDVMSKLCERSSGHFIYAATVLKFVGGDKFSNPLKQLDIILQLLPEIEPVLKTSPYAELDRLYLQVLSTHPDPPQLVEILKFFVEKSNHRNFGEFRPWPDLLDDLLNVEKGYVATSLSGMHSLIHFSDTDSIDRPSRFHHASFPDFLLDRARSRHFHIGHAQRSTQIFAACVSLVIRWLREALHEQSPDPYIPTLEITADPVLVTYRPSSPQNNLKVVVTYLDLSREPNPSREITSEIVRLVKAIPFDKSSLPSRPLLFILRNLVTVCNYKKVLGWRRWLYRKSLPEHRILKAHKTLLSDGVSSELHSLINLLGISGLDHDHSVPVTFLASLYGINVTQLSALIRRCYPFLDFHSESYFIVGYYPRAVSGLGCRWQDFQQDLERHQSPFFRICLQYFSGTNRHPSEKAIFSDWVSKRSYAAMMKILGENSDALLPYLAALKARPFESRTQSREGEIVDLSFVLGFNFQSLILYSPDLYLRLTNKLSKELLFLTDDTPPRIRIHSHFLSSTPDAYLSRYLKNIRGHNFPRIGHARLSSDFRFFVSDFCTHIFEFVLDPKRAGDFLMSRSSLSYDVGFWSNAAIHSPPL